MSLSLAGCSQSASGAPHDERSVAVQTALDRRPPQAFVLSGYICEPQLSESAQQQKIKQYLKMPAAHVGAPVRKQIDLMGEPVPGGRFPKLCRVVTWDASLHVQPGPYPGESQIDTGRIVLDKLGPDQQAMGITYAPYEAHFEPTATGRSLLKAGLASPPTTLQGSMGFSKDVDGKLTASGV